MWGLTSSEDQLYLSTQKAFGTLAKEKGLEIENRIMGICTVKCPESAVFHA